MLFVEYILLYSIFSPTIGFAQSSTLQQNCMQPEFACGECETKLQNDFNALLDSIMEKPTESNRWSEANQSYKIKPDANIDDFIKKTLDIMKSNNPEGDGRLNMIVIGNSESLHETTANSPRIAIKSPDGEFWLTFNTDPKAKGYNNVEIMRWDGKDATFKFQEISFPSKKGEAGHVDLSGQKCVACHREPMRPNWDTYRAWSNVLPPRDDLIETDNSGRIDLAGRSYISFLEKIKSAKMNPTGSNKRLSFLEIPGDGTTDAEKITQMKKTAAKNGFYRVPHYPPKDQLRNYSEKTADLAGSSHLGFDQLAGQNSCRIVNDLKKNPNFDKFKYALAGLVHCALAERDEISWDELKKYVPDSFQDQAYNYFKMSDSLNLPGKKLIPNSKENVLSKIFNHTRASHKLVNSAKDQRAKKMLEMYSKVKGINAKPNEIRHVLTKQTDVPSPFTAIDDPGGVQSVEESDPGLISSLRYILEPLGVSMRSWSMVNGKTVAAQTFSFSDQFADMLEEQKVIQDVYDQSPGDTNTEKCKNLQSESRKALEDSAQFNNSRSNKNSYLESVCSDYPNVETQIEFIRSDLGEKSCMVCHTTMNTHVSEIFKSHDHRNTAARGLLGDGRTLSDHIKTQLSQGRMPPGGWSIGNTPAEKMKNDTERREALIKYVDYITGKKDSICEMGDVRVESNQSIETSGGQK